MDDNTADKQTACPVQRQSWQQYHRQRARLQLLSKAGYQQLAAAEAADHTEVDQVAAGIASLSVEHKVVQVSRTWHVPCCANPDAASDFASESEEQVTNLALSCTYLLTQHSLHWLG